MNVGLTINTLLLIYNISDSLGRYIPNYRRPTKVFLYMVVLLRGVFLLSFPLNTIGWKFSNSLPKVSRYFIIEMKL